MTNMVFYRPSKIEGHYDFGTASASYGHLWLSYDDVNVNDNECKEQLDIVKEKIDEEIRIGVSKFNWAQLLDANQLGVMFFFKDWGEMAEFIMQNTDIDALYKYFSNHT